MKTCFIRCDIKSFYQGRVELRAVNLKRVSEIDRLVLCIFDNDRLVRTVQMKKVFIENVAHNGESLCYAFCFTDNDFIDVTLSVDESERLAHVRNNRFFTESTDQPDIELSITIENAPYQRHYSSLSDYTVEDILAHLRHRMNAKITIEI